VTAIHELVDRVDHSLWLLSLDVMNAVAHDNLAKGEFGD
jgi:hypothetical protein